MNISSVLLTTTNDNADLLCEQINATRYCSVQLREQAELGEKIVALIEAPDLESGVGAYQILEKIPLVTSIAMVFAYDDSERPNANTNTAQTTLNKDQKAEDIRYYGEMFQKF